MNIKFLGTAAAEGWPAVFCDCPACEEARKRGGKSIRTRSSCIIDGKYMVDFPPDTYMHMLRDNLRLSDIEHLIITHSHEDHFYPEDIQMRKEPFAHISSYKKFVVYGNDEVKRRFDITNYEEDIEKRIRFTEVYPYKCYTAGELEFIPLLADHKPNERCYIYIIKKGGKTILYGHDTGIFPESTFEFMKEMHIDAGIFDCTDGPGSCEKYHMGFPAVLKVKERLIKNGCVDSSTKLIVTHFSHNGRMLHEELEGIVSKEGFIAAYDGMELTV